MCVGKSGVIQKREAYFDCTAAPDDNSAALSRAEPPSSSLPASPVRPHWLHGKVHVAEKRRSSADLSLRMIDHR